MAVKFWWTEIPTEIDLERLIAQQLIATVGIAIIQYIREHPNYVLRILIETNLAEYNE